MKKQKLASKLELKKITISKLNSDQIQRFVGGQELTVTCPSRVGCGVTHETCHTCNCTDRLCEPTTRTRLCP